MKTEKRSAGEPAFELLKMQERKGLPEIVIAAGAETETRRIQEIISEESSLARLNPTYMAIGLSEGFLCLSPDAGKYFNGFLKDKKRASP